MTKLISVGVLCASAGVASAQGMEGLFGYAGGSNDLYSIGASPVSAALIGNDLTSGIPAEIEYGNGVIYASDTGNNNNLHLIDPTTGLVQSTLTMSFPAQGNVITSMEFVGTRLYAGLTTEGGGETFLSTIDLNTGNVSVVGAGSGAGSPFGGLAYHAASGTMYGVTSGGSIGTLYEIDLNTGVASNPLAVLVGGTLTGMTALEFGTDGRLYGLPNNSTGIAGHLLSIDRFTGESIDLGDTGVSNMNALTSIPAPGTLALLGTLAIGRRRRA
jgi:hypothetical protein